MAKPEPHSPLQLLAVDEEDLAVLSAALQDEVSTTETWWPSSAKPASCSRNTSDRASSTCSKS